MLKIQEKLDKIYDDLELNVTRIYERRELLLAYDLAYHSVLQFEFMGQMITRGWVEILVVGDTRCGKTKTAERLLRHYRAGEMGTGENTSTAGLIGGMQQISKQWSIIWGKFPRNDRKLIIIDEASNIPTNSIPDFATIRSEGVARITKIQSEQTHSRTRAIWISNPRPFNDSSGFNISDYDYGVHTVTGLIGRPADVARFDVACVVSNGEVDPESIFGRDRESKPEHIYTSDLSHALVLWAWSRSPTDVVIENETEQEIFLQAKRLAKKYHESIPLIKIEELPEKLARLSTSLAARLFSSRDGNNLVVLPDHAAYIADYLDRTYSKAGMGYAAYSKKLFRSETVTDRDEVIDTIAKYGEDFVQGMLSYSVIRQNTVEDLTGLNRDEVRAFIGLLVRKRCLKPENMWYKKTAPFVRILKEIEDGKIKLKEEEVLF